MGLKGELSTMGLEDIFQWLQVGKKSGVLELKGLLHTKRIGFHEGFISSVWSSDPREYLGQYLLAYNRISEEQLRQALAAQEDENQLLGRILVDRHLISEEQIRQIMQLKVEESIYDTFLWTVGSFEFHDGAQPQKTLMLALEITGIIFEGARRIDEWKRIRKVLKGGDAVVAPIPDAIAEMLPLAPEDADVLGRLDGHKTVDQLVLEMRVPEFKASKLVFDLHEKGMVAVIDPGGKLGDSSSLQIQRARQLLEKQKLQEAEEALAKILTEHPKIHEAQHMLQVVQHMRNAKPLDQDLVPELAVGIEELMVANLGPNEAFLATRVNGVWTIRDIMAISPFSHEECLAIFAKLFERGILKAESGGLKASGLRA